LPARHNALPERLGDTVILRVDTLQREADGRRETAAIFVRHLFLTVP